MSIDKALENLGFQKILDGKRCLSYVGHVDNNNISLTHRIDAIKTNSDGVFIWSYVAELNSEGNNDAIGLRSDIAELVGQKIKEKWGE